MSSKIFCLLIIFAFSGIFLPAQTREKMKRNKRQKTVQKNREKPQTVPPKESQTAEKTIQAADPQQLIRGLMRIDPRMPGNGAGEIQRRIEYIRKNYVEREFPRKVQAFRKGSTNTASGLRATAFAYKKNLSHPDLEEATGIRLEWYNRVGTAFVALYESLESVERGAMMHDSKRYTAAALRYKALVQELAKILEKPEKIPSRELEKLKEKNTARRKREIQKKIDELLRKKGNNNP